MSPAKLHLTVQILIPAKQQVKKTKQGLVFLTWCTIADVKITFPDDSEGDIKEIRELLDDKTGTEETSK